MLFGRTMRTGFVGGECGWSWRCVGKLANSGAQSSKMGSKPR
jgi:hypothetical protein